MCGVSPPTCRFVSALQICAISEELLKTEYDALRIVYNRFGSAVSFKPTIATVLSPDVSLTLPATCRHALLVMAAPAVLSTHLNGLAALVPATCGATIQACSLL